MLWSNADIVAGVSLHEVSRKKSFKQNKGLFSKKKEERSIRSTADIVDSWHLNDEDELPRDRRKIKKDSSRAVFNDPSDHETAKTTEVAVQKEKKHKGFFRSIKKLFGRETRVTKAVAEKTKPVSESKHAGTAESETNATSEIEEDASIDRKIFDDTLSRDNYYGRLEDAYTTTSMVVAQTKPSERRGSNDYFNDLFIDDRRESRPEVAVHNTYEYWRRGSFDRKLDYGIEAESYVISPSQPEVADRLNLYQDHQTLDVADPMPYVSYYDRVIDSETTETHASPAIAYGGKTDPHRERSDTFDELFNESSRVSRPTFESKRVHSQETSNTVAPSVVHTDLSFEREHKPPADVPNGNIGDTDRTIVEKLSTLESEIAALKLLIRNRSTDRDKSGLFSDSDTEAITEVEQVKRNFVDFPNRTTGYSSKRVDADDSLFDASATAEETNYEALFETGTSEYAREDQDESPRSDGISQKAVATDEEFMSSLANLKHSRRDKMKTENTSGSRAVEESTLSPDPVDKLFDGDLSSPYDDLADDSGRERGDHISQNESRGSSALSQEAVQEDVETDEEFSLSLAKFKNSRRDKVKTDDTSIGLDLEEVKPDSMDIIDDSAYERADISDSHEPNFKASDPVENLFTGDLTSPYDDFVQRNTTDSSDEFSEVKDIKIVATEPSKLKDSDPVDKPFSRDMINPYDDSDHMNMSAESDTSSEFKTPKVSVGYDVKKSSKVSSTVDNVFAGTETLAKLSVDERVDDLQAHESPKNRFEEYSERPSSTLVTDEASSEPVVHKTEATTDCINLGSIASNLRIRLSCPSSDIEKVSSTDYDKSWEELQKSEKSRKAKLRIQRQRRKKGARPEGSKGSSATGNSKKKRGGVKKSNKEKPKETSEALQNPVEVADDVAVLMQPVMQRPTMRPRRKPRQVVIN